MKLSAIPFAVIAGLAVAARAETTESDNPFQSDEPVAPPDTDAGNGGGQRTAPPLNALVVDISGNHPNSYRTLNDALAVLPNTTASQTIFIYPGFYFERVVVRRLHGPLVIQGYSTDPMHYASNQVTFSHAQSAGGFLPELNVNPDSSASTMVIESFNGVKLYNLNIENTARPPDYHGNSPAVYVGTTEIGFYGCNFTAAVGTVAAINGDNQLYARCKITALEDHIVGTFIAWFETCDFESTGNGSITATGTDFVFSASQIVLNNAKITTPATSVAQNAFLGRAIGKWARVTVQNSLLGQGINPKGWLPPVNHSTNDIFFEEFNNTGPGAATDQRAAFSVQLDAPLIITNFFGRHFKDERYIDASYVQV